MINIEEIPSELKPYLIKRKFKKGEYIFTSGSENHCVYFIKSGSCISSITDDNGALSFVENYTEGDIFGELELFCKSLKTINMLVTQESIVYSLQKKYLLEWMKQDFDFNLSIIEHLAEGMRRFSDNAAIIQLYNVKERVAFSILRYDAINSLDQMNKKDIMFMAKAPLRSVNRALKSLANCHAIEFVNKNVKIVNRELLQQISNYSDLNSL